MTSLNNVTIASSGLLTNPSGSRNTATALQSDSSALAENAAPSTSTQVTLGNMPATALNAVYTKPAAVETTRAWATDTKDDISTLMARNRDRAPVGSLAEQWRGLGGALLSQLSTTGTGYRQAMVDYVTAQGTERTQAMDALAHSGVENGAATVSLKIKTRSGQNVELKILVNTGASGGNRGIQVEVTSSGKLSDSERKALADLAEGFDQALEGLGQSGKLKMDLSKLMDYDRSALASVDMNVKNPKADQALSTFSLHLGDDQKTLAFKGALGDIAMNVDNALPFGPGASSASQRQTAINAQLQKFDAAAGRSHADAKLVALFKDVFSQMHSAPADGATPQASALTPALTLQVQPLLSGLADFQASFGGDFEKTNDRGFINEIGRADYQLSQTTTVKHNSHTGDASITQTQSEKLDAHYLKARSNGMLDTGSGNYDIHKISDQSTSTTLIETAEKKLVRAVRDTEQHQLETRQKLVKFRVVEESSTPLEKRLQEVLW